MYTLKSANKQTNRDKSAVKAKKMVLIVICVSKTPFLLVIGKTVSREID